MKKIATIISLLLIAATISSQGISVIKGKLKKGKGTIIYLQQVTQNKNNILDSAKVNWCGNYKLKTTVKEHDFYQITSNKSKNNEMILVLLKGGGETVKIKSLDFKSKDYSVKKSPDNLLIQQYMQMKSTKGITKDSIAKYAMSFVKKNNKSLAVFLALNDVKNPKKAIEIAEKGISENYKDSKYHKSLKNALVQMKKQGQKPKSLGVGEIAPEMNLKNPKGEIMTLASLKGKYVLIDFWASWCGPCRRENPTVVRLYNKYKDQGFEVYSVSLDKQKSRWEAAIKKDGLIWKSHVSDLKGWRTVATKLYGFGGIPYTVLIDKEGKIIATRLRGAALENKLKEIFKNQ